MDIAMQIIEVNQHIFILIASQRKFTIAPQAKILTFHISYLVNTQNDHISSGKFKYQRQWDPVSGKLWQQYCFSSLIISTERFSCQEHEPSSHFMNSRFVFARCSAYRSIIPKTRCHEYFIFVRDKVLDVFVCMLKFHQYVMFNYSFLLASIFLCVSVIALSCVVVNAQDYDNDA